MDLGESLADRGLNGVPAISSFITASINVTSSTPSEKGLVAVVDGNSTTVTSSGVLGSRWLPFQAEVSSAFSC